MTLEKLERMIGPRRDIIVNVELGKVFVWSGHIIRVYDANGEHVETLHINTAEKISHYDFLAAVDDYLVDYLIDDSGNTYEDNTGYPDPYNDL